MRAPISQAKGDEPLLEVRNLTVEFKTRQGVFRALDGVNFELRAGETLGLVGESGSGKSVTALAILRLLPRTARVSGQIRFRGGNLLDLSDQQFRKLRGHAISMILQDPMTSLNPVFKIGWQVGEAVAIQEGLQGAARKGAVTSLLRSVHIPAPELRQENFPHQMSGGMRQRVVGATALAGNPQILICDEPTTALDATIQSQYLQLLREIQKKYGLALIFITHDFGAVAEMCDHVAVMYAGKIRETGNVFQIFDHPSHPYTKALLASVPKLGEKDRLTTIPGQPPMSGESHAGCAFAPRCAAASDQCLKEPPPSITVGDGHWGACWRL